MTPAQKSTPCETTELPAIQSLLGKPKKVAQTNRLVAFVKKAVQENPHKRGGLDWCAHPQTEIAEAIGVSVRSLQTLIKTPPFFSENALVGQGEQRRKVALIRILGTDEKAKPTPQTIACGMRRVFLQRYGKDMVGNGKAFTPQMHGCLVGLAEVWPDGAQMAIFKSVLDDWQAFMAGVAMVIEAKQAAGLDPKAVKNFYKSPSPSVMRRFHGVAIHLHGMKLQEAASKTGAMTMTPAFSKAYFSQDQFFGLLTEAEIVALDDAPIAAFASTFPPPFPHGMKMALKSANQ